MKSLKKSIFAILLFCSSFFAAISQVYAEEYPIEPSTDAPFVVSVLQPDGKVIIDTSTGGKSSEQASPENQEDQDFDSYNFIAQEGKYTVNIICSGDEDISRTCHVQVSEDILRIDKNAVAVGQFFISFTEDGNFYSKAIQLGLADNDWTDYEIIPLDVSATGISRNHSTKLSTNEFFSTSSSGVDITGYKMVSFTFKIQKSTKSTVELENQKAVMKAQLENMDETNANLDDEPLTGSNEATSSDKANNSNSIVKKPANDIHATEFGGATSIDTTNTGDKEDDGNSNLLLYIVGGGIIFGIFFIMYKDYHEYDNHPSNRHSRK